MVQYSITITNKNTTQKYRYNLDLEQHYENYPTIFFTPIICHKIRNELESQSGYQINNTHLQIIIKTWIQDIKEGYRDSDVILDLVKMNPQDIHNLIELGNQKNPPLISPDLSDIEPKIGELPPLDFS